MKSRQSGATNSKLDTELREAKITLPRYITVGIGSVVIGMVTIWYFTEVAGLYYLVSGGLSALFSILFDFTFNEVWTFSHRRKGRLFSTKLLRRLSKFFVSKTVGFIIAISALAFLTQVVGLHYLVSNLFAIGIAFVWNYSASTFWVWSKKKELPHDNNNHSS
jgi:dolichol-phosphate mannosyltransferase